MESAFDDVALGRARSKSRVSDGPARACAQIWSEPGAVVPLREIANSERTSGEHLVIAVVGPCASGKSTLVRRLRARGYSAREVAQEHSCVETMWRRVARPDLLIYLDVSQEIAGRRRGSDTDRAWWREVELRLSDARRHADVCVDTDGLSPEEVLDRVLSFLRHQVP